MKSITVLKLKLDVTESDTDRLEHVADLCRRARNVASEDWLLRNRGRAESERQARINAKTGKPLGESTKLYHAIGGAVPSLGSQLRSAIANQVGSFLSAKLDWRRQPKKVEGEKPKKLKRSDAILSYEDRVPYFTATEICAPNCECDVTFEEKPILSIALLTGESPLRLTIRTSKLPGRFKSILHELASGERKLADSRIIERKGEWFWHLPIAFETEVRSDVEATLSPETDKDKRPFRLQLPGRTWTLGDGRYLLSQTKRLQLLKKEIGWRYRQRMGAGHGRQKIDEAVRKRSYQLANIIAEVRRRAIADVVRQCVRDNVGHLIYREPTGPAKDKCWFTQNGLEWDWTRFGGDLKNAANRQGIEVTIKKLSIKEVLDANKPAV